MTDDGKDKNQKQENSLIENEELVIRPGADAQAQADLEGQTDAVGQADPVKGQEIGERSGVGKMEIPELDATKTESEKKTVVLPSEKKKRKKYTEGERLFKFRFEQLKKGKKKTKKEPVIKYELKKPKLFLLRKDEKVSFAALFARNLALFVLSLLLFAGHLYLDDSLFAAAEPAPKAESLILIPENQSITITDQLRSAPVYGTYKLEGGENIMTGAVENVQITLADYGVVRLGTETELLADEISNDKNKYIFELISGTVWVNTGYGDFDLAVNTKHVTVKPGKSAVNISYDGSRTLIYSDKHEALVELKDINGNFLNRFWITEGNRAELSDSKINSEADTIKRLLYDKLIKEFRYSRMPHANIDEDSWILAQRRYDSELRENIYKKYYASLRSEGLKVVSPSSLRFTVRSLISDLNNVLVFSETKKIDRLIDSIFENLHDAKYLYAQANETDAQVRLSIFVQDINQTQYSSDEYFILQTFDRIKNELADLYFVTPSDALYPVKSELYSLLMQNKYKNMLGTDRQFDYLTMKLNDVYDSIDADPTKAVGVFSLYLGFYDTIRGFYRDDVDSIADQILKQNILVDNILLFNPDLYKTSFFVKKFSMEADYLLALEDEREKREQRQALISIKIDLLSRIRHFLFSERITPEDARQIVFLIIRDIEELKKKTLDVAAVNRLFEARLKDFGAFWQYLNNPEYSTVPIHGESHSERFEAFKRVQEEILTFSAIQEEILGVAEEERTVRSVIIQAEDDLQSEGVTNVEFGFYNDVTSTRIPILSAQISGITFRATYDWDRKILSNIIVGDDLLTGDGVNLKNARRFILESMSARDTVHIRDDVPPETVEREPLADAKRAAKVFIKQKFSQMDIVLETDNVEVKNLSAGEYVISNVYYAEIRDAVFSFEYRTTDDKVLRLAIETKQGEKIVSDSFSPRFLRAVVEKVYQEAL